MTTVIEKPSRRKGLRMSEPCKYEKEIGVMSEGIKDVKATLVTLVETLSGKNGVVTQTALNKASLSRVWWFVGIGIPAGVVIIGGLIAFV